MDVNAVLGLPSELLYLWHTHRIELLLSAGVLVACVRLAIHWRRSQSKVVLTPPLGMPVDEKREVGFAVPVEVQLADLDHYEVPQPISRPKTGPKRVTGGKRTKSMPPETRSTETNVENIQPLIFYFSLGGSTRSHAEKLQASLSANDTILPAILHDLTAIDYDDFFTTIPKQHSSATPFYLLTLPSYDISTELDNFLDHLKEVHHDFRIDTHPLRSLAGYSVFGLGDKEGWPSEDRGFCKDAVAVDKWMARLTGGRRAWPLGCGDVKGSDLGSEVEEWSTGVKGAMEELVRGGGLGEGVLGSGDAVESGDEDEDEVDDDPAATSTGKRNKPTRTPTSDLEDLKAPIPLDFTTNSPNTNPPVSIKQMVPNSSPTYTSLTKQGYTIVGTHSGVKTCRWTKSALRGRGSCYKHSFYGIASHLCMEATPSLSCSNKCVFCWRHGTNPVSTTWKWEVNDPQDVFEGMLAGHYQKIKVMKGVPGVRAERFQEAMRVRHCALSLVGEPIFYPRINDLLALLHDQRISTFLVCNAQHPDQLAALDKVTQLYVSIDASNRDSLKRIDRPLHRDFWERFLRCLDIIKQKRFQQRTVFRLTLVKGFNIDAEAEGYADLVARGLPGFVEVKGVTYCGTSTAAGAGLSMQNVPFYEEVTAFVLALELALKKRGLQYGIAAEHAHSCCVLLADRSRFFRAPAASGEGGSPDGSGGGKWEKKWHTLIDYEEFFDCLESGGEFGPEDYVGGPTAEWALWGKGGFDPRDERVDRKGRPRG